MFTNVSLLRNSYIFAQLKRVAELRGEVAELRGSGRNGDNITENIRPLNSAKIVYYSVTADLQQIVIIRYHVTASF